MANGNSTRSSHFPKFQLLSLSLIAFFLCNSAVAVEAFIPDPALVRATRSHSAPRYDYVPKTSFNEGRGAAKSEAIAQKDDKVRETLRPQEAPFKANNKRQQLSPKAAKYRAGRPRHNLYAPQYYQHPVPNHFQRGADVSHTPAHPPNQVHRNLDQTLHAFIPSKFGNSQRQPIYWNVEQGLWLPVPIPVEPAQGLIAAHHTQPPQSLPSEADLENQVQRNLQATLQAHISPNFGNSQSTHSSTHDPAPRGYLRWNDQLRVWEPWQVEKYDPNAPEPVVDHGKLWEDIDRDIVDVVHNEVVRLPQENELIKQDDLLPHNHQPLKESYPSFYDSHSSSIPVVSPKKSDSNILSDESDSQDLQNGIKEKELVKIQVDPQSTDVKVETPDSPNSLDDWNSVVADNHTPSQNEESILKSEDLQPIKRFNSLFQDKQQALTTPTSNPTAWPSLRPSRIKGANKEAHRLVYSQALTT